MAWFNRTIAKVPKRRVLVFIHGLTTGLMTRSSASLRISTTPRRMAEGFPLDSVQKPRIIVTVVDPNLVQLGLRGDADLASAS